MARFQLKKYTEKQVGFTLIEVLVALAIFAIALTAIMKAVSQNIKDHRYVQNKTIAVWVAGDVINQARLGLLNVSEFPEKEMDMLGQSWLWKASVTETANVQIKKIQVEVFQQGVKLVSMIGYLNDEKK